MRTSKQLIWYGVKGVAVLRFLQHYWWIFTQQPFFHIILLMVWPFFDWEFIFRSYSLTYNLHFEITLARGSENRFLKKWVKTDKFFLNDSVSMLLVFFWHTLYLSTYLVQINDWINDGMNEQMNGWTNKRMNEWIDKWVNE